MIIQFRHITITGYNHNDPAACLSRWNQEIEKMNGVCDKMGRDKCLLVQYEQLVLHPRKTMEKVLNFLGINWDSSVLRKEK